MIPSANNHFAVGPIPAQAGIGLRAEHYHEVVETKPAIAWFEAHSENYFGAGGRPLYFLERVRADYPVSLHGVGLSLGSADALNLRHLEKLRDLIQRIEPGLVSEHLSWGSVGGRYLNDLLPLPYTDETLRHLIERVQQVQEFLGRQILIENISCYLEYEDTTLAEPQFLAELARRSGCALLLDVNNVYVNAVNHRFDPFGYVAAIPADLVQEIHLAGHTRRQLEDGAILIDTHDQLVTPAVWELYRAAVARLGRIPTLIEWDSDLPALEVLLAEAAHAEQVMEVGYADVA
ncbi:MAG: DUF692 domain-containing protein [Pseudomonadota bacterium]